MSTKEEAFLNFSDILDCDEIEKFNASHHDWLDADGTFKMLHRINPIRVRYIERMIKTHMPHAHLNHSNSKLLESHATEHSSFGCANLKILDLGCGGGLVSQALSNLGYDVCGADASEAHIQMVRQQHVNSRVRYVTFDQLNEMDMRFDVVLCLEMIEHVRNPQKLIKLVSQLAHPSGIIIISTINRTAKSYFTAIVLAEYILRAIPRHTHSYNKLLRPSEINKMCTQYNMCLLDLTGLSYSFLHQEWRLVKDLSVNYFCTVGIKEKFCDKFLSS